MIVSPRSALSSVIFFCSTIALHASPLPIEPFTSANPGEHSVVQAACGSLRDYSEVDQSINLLESIIYKSRRDCTADNFCRTVFVDSANMRCLAIAYTKFDPALAFPPITETTGFDHLTNDGSVPLIFTVMRLGVVENLYFLETLSGQQFVNFSWESE